MQLIKVSHAIKYILSIFLLIVISCDFEWNNPYDSSCPKESFTPTNFKAKQEGKSVVLSWSQPNKHISGYIIEKSTNGLTWSYVGYRSPLDTTWSDTNISAGIIHNYYLTATAGNNHSNKVYVQITPDF